jgi:zinc transporter 1
MFLKSPKRFYADPAISLFIACVIFGTSIPLIMRSGKMLMGKAPNHIDVKVERLVLLDKIWLPDF